MTSLGPESQNHHVTFVLECVECGRQSEEEARGWRAYLDEDSSDVWLYCAVCAEREFGMT